LIKNARTVKSLSDDNKALIFTFNDAVTDTRHFRIGNRVILDVFFDSDSMASLMKPMIKTPTKTVVVVEDEIKPNVELKLKAEPKLTVIVNEPAPLLNEEESQLVLAGATVVTISSVKPFGLSIFELKGRLFVVTDQADMAIPPQVAGQGAKLGWTMAEIPMTNGKAWMMPLPKGSFVRPEGRGLIWRAVISDINPNLGTTDIRRRMTDPSNPKIDVIVNDIASLLRLTDPDYGDDLAVITVKKASSRMMIPYDFVDFDIIPAFVGAVIKPETDGLRLASSDDFVTISNINKLIVAADSQNAVIDAYLNNDGQKLAEISKVQTTLDRIYYFPDWGSTIKPHEYVEKRKELDAFLAMSDAEDKLGVILDLVKLTLSQGMGQESLGYLKLAQDLNPQISKISEYQALRGAAHFLSSQYDLAEGYLGSDELKNIAEAGLWHSASLAAQGRYEKSMEKYNNNAVLAGVYPYEIKRQVVAPLALAAINQDDADTALDLIEIIDSADDSLTAEERATVAYLKGRAQSMAGRPDEAISNLYKASLGDKLGPYGIRSELLLVQDELAREVIEMDEAIQRMERLRFAWRGDSLEPEIYEALGSLYIDSGAPRKGLGILKRAAGNAESVQERRQIVRMMANAFKSIFIGEKFETTDPLIAVAVYDEFKELTPVGNEGNELINRLADKLMSINLMSRATQVLKDKMDRLGEGQDAIKTGVRIATIQLLDREPEAALKTLVTVNKMMAPYRGEDKDLLNNKIVLLRARGLAETGNPEQALFMTEGLDDTDDVIRLRIDTAWKTNNWVAVTDNLAKLLARQNINPNNPPTAEQAQLILNQAVALSLSNQYDALQRFAATYDMAMKQTPNYKTFLVVSRPQNISNLADRETLLEVTSEVDLFQGVLKKEGEEN